MLDYDNVHTTEDDDIHDENKNDVGDNVDVVVAPSILEWNQPPDMTTTFRLMDDMTTTATTTADGRLMANDTIVEEGGGGVAVVQHHTYDDPSQQVNDYTTDYVSGYLPHSTFSYPLQEWNKKSPSSSLPLPPPPPPPPVVVPTMATTTTTNDISTTKILPPGQNYDNYRHNNHRQHHRRQRQIKNAFTTTTTITTTTTTTITTTAQEHHHPQQLLHNDHHPLDSTIISPSHCYFPVVNHLLEEEEDCNDDNDGHDQKGPQPSPQQQPPVTGKSSIKLRKQGVVGAPARSTNSISNNNNDDDDNNNRRDHLEASWRRQFENLCRFKEMHGHCLVPRQYKENPQLAVWVKTQRYQYRNLLRGETSRLTETRVKALEDIGFVWRLKKSTSLNNQSSQAGSGGCSSIMTTAATVATAAADDDDDDDDDSNDYWKARLEDLVMFKDKMGHCNVPCRYADDLRLGQWVKKQRCQYENRRQDVKSSLTEDRIRQLDDLGFVWRLVENKVGNWRQRYDELKEYKEKHGDCLVPQASTGYPKLGSWVNTQRYQYTLFKSNKPSQLSATRIRLLEDIDFKWSLKSRNPLAWQHRYLELKDYKKKHGDCYVPQAYRDNPSLGKWVNKQRFEYKKFKEGKKSSLTETRIQTLEKIGFRFDTFGKRKRKENGSSKVGGGAGVVDNNSEKDGNVMTRDKNWYLILEDLKAYKDKFGHCMVPNKYEDDPQLGVWVKTQRHQYQNLKKGKKTTMTAERAKSLEELGFVWSIKSFNSGLDIDSPSISLEQRSFINVPEKLWKMKLDELIEYKEKIGDCNVPNKFDSNPSLGRWVFTQRYQYQNLIKGKKSSLTEDRIQMLEDIGFAWTVKEKDMWSRRYEELKTFKVEHGNTIVPVAYKDNPKLGGWVSNQRYQYKLLRSGKPSRLSKERLMLLQKLDFAWCIKEGRECNYDFDTTDETSMSQVNQSSKDKKEIGDNVVKEKRTCDDRDVMSNEDDHMYETKENAMKEGQEKMLDCMIWENFLI